MSATDPRPQPEGPLSEQELTELEKLEHAATAAPWWYDEGPLYWRLHGTGGWTPEQGSGEYRILPQPLNHQILKAAKRSEVFEPYWPLGSDGPLIPVMRNALPRLIAEVREWRAQARASVTELRAENRALKARLAALEEWAQARPTTPPDKFASAEDVVVEDGFGGSWLRCKPGCDLHVVRPGKVQCSCEHGHE